MLYKNVRTGVVIDVISKVSGDWVPVNARKPETAEAKKAPVSNKKTTKTKGK
ncbi:MAG: hypothetical protein IJU01_00465 [Lachnospiraceae bacterium]|nr:hypothetical protein [Lachnospiraceae bacterium]